ncbi:type II toxin-antitoxin system Phd/YefM family antitoxin [Ferrovibrio sp.]|uniref:type II toxin-antitoxin system Phd/YefM family antitoxin n=1 Tax=Ferrovibrio sp. TaxID=1917215 RepID=UPI003D0AC4DD
MTRMIKASEFKAKCLGLMDEVAASGESIIITKNGKPVATLAPARKYTFDEAYGALKDKIRITGDIISPASDPEDWEVLRD